MIIYISINSLLFQDYLSDITIIQKVISAFLLIVLYIPIENITGLGNSTGEAKANWMVDKAAEGYNDFYFADDAYQNVKAVKDVLSQLDVKSKVQQARISLSTDLSKRFNQIIEEEKSENRNPVPQSIILNSGLEVSATGLTTISNQIFSLQVSE